MKVLLVGKIRGQNRSQLLIESLLQKDYSKKEEITINLLDVSFFSYKGGFTCWVGLIFNRLLNILLSLIFCINLTINIFFCDKVVLLAMNNKIFPIIRIITFLLRKELIVDMYNSIFDASLDRKIFQKSLFSKIINLNFASYLKWIDKSIIQYSDRLIQINEYELKFISQLVGAKLNKRKYYIIPIGFEQKAISNSTRSGVFRICWWGTITPFHGIEAILEAIAILKSKNVRFKLAILTTYSAKIEQIICLIQNLKITDFVEIYKDKSFGNGRLEEYLINECDLALGNFGDSGRVNRAIPTKIIEAFSIKLPVLTKKTDILEKTFDTKKDLFCCEGNPEKICDSIYYIIMNDIEREEKAISGYLVYKDRYSKKQIIDEFRNVIID